MLPQAGPRLRAMRSSLRYAALAVVLLVSACATALTSYEPQPIDRYRNTQTKNGLAIAVDPVRSGHFGLDLPSTDVIAVYVVAVNRHPSSSYVLSRQRIALIAGDLQAARKDTSPGGRDTRAATGVGSNRPVDPTIFFNPVGLVVIAALIPVALTVQHAETSGEETQYRLRAQEFQNRTLAPGEGAAGFVYFQLPRGVRLPPKWTVRIEASTAGHDDRMPFEFDLGR